MSASQISPKQKYFAGIFTVMIALMVFLGGNFQKDQYRLHSQRYTKGSHTIPFLVGTDATYKIAIWAVDEETGLQQWATMSCEGEIRDSSGKLVDAGEAVATASDEKGGIRRAQNGFDLDVQSTKTEELVLTVHLLEGDYVDVEVLQDIPTLIHLLPGIGVLIGFAGAILITKGRAGMGQPV